MKNFLPLAAALCFQLSFSQVSGNINYRNRTQYPENNINIADPVIAQNVNENIISIKGLANVRQKNMWLYSALPRLQKALKK